LKELLKEETRTYRFELYNRGLWDPVKKTLIERNVTSVSTLIEKEKPKVLTSELKNSVVAVGGVSTKEKEKVLTSTIFKVSQQQPSLSLVKQGKGKFGKGRNKQFNPHGIRLRGGMLLLPPRILVETRFEKQIDMNNLGATFANIRLEPTFAYDVDPVVGSTAMPYFTEWGGIYRFYRVIYSKLHVEFASADSNPVTCAICPVNFDPTANTVNYQNYFSNPNSKEVSLGLAQGQGAKALTMSRTTDHFAGSKWTGTSDSYSALSAGASPPSNNWYWFIGARNLSNFVNGVFVAAVMDVHIVFFEQTSPSA